MTLSSRLFSCLAPALLLCSPLAAQGLAPAGDADAPVLRVTPAAASVVTAPAPAPMVETNTIGAEVAARAAKGEGTILMIVGGAALVTGLIIDEPIIYIPGAIVGLYGLYRYLKSGN